MEWSRRAPWGWPCQESRPCERTQISCPQSGDRGSSGAWGGLGWVTDRGPLARPAPGVPPCCPGWPLCGKTALESWTSLALQYVCCRLIVYIFWSYPAIQVVLNLQSSFSNLCACFIINVKLFESSSLQHISLSMNDCIYQALNSNLSAVSVSCTNSSCSGE